MAGRAGRVHGGPAAKVDVVIRPEDEDYARESLSVGGNPDACSSFGSVDELAFHLMPEVCSGRVSDVESAEGWHSRSLHALQGGRADFGAVLSKLSGWGAVRMDADGSFKATKLGRLASAFYFHPADADAWVGNFTTVFDGGFEENDVAAAWALGSVPTRRVRGDLGSRRGMVNEFVAALPAGLETRDGSVLASVVWWSVIGGPSVGPMRNCVLEMREDSGRVISFLGRVDEEVAGWAKSWYFERLSFQARHGVSSELVPLRKLPGVGKKLAEALYNAGMRSPEDVVEAAGLGGGVAEEEIGMAARGMADELF